MTLLKCITTRLYRGTNDSRAGHLLREIRRRGAQRRQALGEAVRLELLARQRLEQRRPGGRVSRRFLRGGGRRLRGGGVRLADGAALGLGGGRLWGRRRRLGLPGDVGASVPRAHARLGELSSCGRRRGSRCKGLSVVLDGDEKVELLDCPGPEDVDGSRVRRSKGVLDALLIRGHDLMCGGGHNA